MEAVEDCLFCGIASGDIPGDIVYSDDGALAFHDINPQAPTHVLVIPRAHVRNIAEAGVDPDVAAALLHGIGGTVEKLNLHDYRTVFNTGVEVGQSVFHVHAHVLAGTPMGWPPF